MLLMFQKYYDEMNGKEKIQHPRFDDKSSRANITMLHEPRGDKGSKSKAKASPCQLDQIALIIIIIGLRSVSALKDVIGGSRPGTNNSELLEPRREEREKVLS